MMSKLVNGAIVIGVLIFFILCFFVVVSFNGCAGPRSSTMCLKSGYWVKCPKGIQPGTEL